MACFICGFFFIIFGARSHRAQPVNFSFNEATRKILRSKNFRDLSGLEKIYLGILYILLGGAIYCICIYI